MCGVTLPGMPVIDVSHFELELSPGHRRAFRDLIYKLIIELHLQNEIEHLELRSPPEPRSVLYRQPYNPWPSKRIVLAIYPVDKYMDEQKLRHELGHEADRRNPEMQSDPDLESRWTKCGAFEVAANLSLDARLGERGLGPCFRWEEFKDFVGENFQPLFAELWANPPSTWPEIETLAKRLVAIHR